MQTGFTFTHLRFNLLRHSYILQSCETLEHDTRCSRVEKQSDRFRISIDRLLASRRDGIGSVERRGHDDERPSVWVSKACAG